jgi:hypothetical protein
MLYIGFYLRMLSKPLYAYGKDLENKFIKDSHKDNNIEIDLFTYKSYKIDQNLKKFKMNKLKDIVKYHKIPVTGTKRLLLERLENHFKKSIFCEKIQRIFRGYLIRKLMILRGPAIKNRSICVNDTDFITLEPLHEIPTTNFFSYTIDKHIYGCSIFSLAEYIRKNGVKIQPYNRSPFPDKVINDFHLLWTIVDIFYIFPEDVIKENCELLTTLDPTHQIIEKLRIVRMNTIDQRILEAFMEIDQLGNYTNSQWFSSLSAEQYCIFYRQLFEIWARLPVDIREKIYIIGHPFVGHQRENGSLRDIIYIKEACTFVIENLIYGGIDIEYRKLGALHILTALTVASIHARNSMYWLYESLAF